MKVRVINTCKYYSNSIYRDRIGYVLGFLSLDYSNTINDHPVTKFNLLNFERIIYIVHIQKRILQR